MKAQSIVSIFAHKCFRAIELQEKCEFPAFCSLLRGLTLEDYNYYKTVPFPIPLSYELWLFFSPRNFELLEVNITALGVSYF